MKLELDITTKDLFKHWDDLDFYVIGETVAKAHSGKQADFLKGLCEYAGKYNWSNQCAAISHEWENSDYAIKIDIVDRLKTLIEHLEQDGFPDLGDK